MACLLIFSCLCFVIFREHFWLLNFCGDSYSFSSYLLDVFLSKNVHLFFVPLYVKFRASLSLAIEYMVLTDVLLCVRVVSGSFRMEFDGSGCFCNVRLLILNSLSDQHFPVSISSILGQPFSGGSG